MNLDKTYIDFIKQLKQKILIAKNRATLSVNRAMIELYFDIGKEIVIKQESLGWGKSVVEQMAKDLQLEFGKRSRYSSANLWRMRIFYLTYRDNPNLAQLVREIPLISKKFTKGNKNVNLHPTIHHNLKNATTHQ